MHVKIWGFSLSIINQCLVSKTISATSLKVSWKKLESERRKFTLKKIDTENEKSSPRHSSLIWKTVLTTLPWLVFSEIKIITIHYQVMLKSFTLSNYLKDYINVSPKVTCMISAKFIVTQKVTQITSLSTKIKNLYKKRHILLIFIMHAIQWLYWVLPKQMASESNLLCINMKTEAEKTVKENGTVVFINWSWTYVSMGIWSDKFFGYYLRNLSSSLIHELKPMRRK